MLVVPIPYWVHGRDVCRAQLGDEAAGVCDVRLVGMPGADIAEHPREGVRGVVDQPEIGAEMDRAQSFSIRVTRAKASLSIGRLDARSHSVIVRLVGRPRPTSCLRLPGGVGSRSGTGTNTTPWRTPVIRAVACITPGGDSPRTLISDASLGRSSHRTRGGGSAFSRDPASRCAGRCGTRRAAVRRHQMACSSRRSDQSPVSPLKTRRAAYRTQETG